MSNVLEDFNHTLDTWIDILNENSFERLTTVPIRGGWSLAQVFVHLIEDTRWHVGQMKAALATADNSDKPMHPNAKEMFSNNMFPDILIEGAATVDNIPQPVSKEMLSRQLTSIREEVNSAWRSTDFLQSKGKTEHPGLWFFSAAEWLQFTEMHMRHHLRQKKRIEAAL